MKLLVSTTGQSVEGGSGVNSEKVVTASRNRYSQSAILLTVDAPAEPMRLLMLMSCEPTHAVSITSRQTNEPYIGEL